MVGVEHRGDRDRFEAGDPAALTDEPVRPGAVRDRDALTRRLRDLLRVGGDLGRGFECDDGDVAHSGACGGARDVERGDHAPARVVGGARDR